MRISSAIGFFNRLFMRFATQKYVKILKSNEIFYNFVLSEKVETPKAVTGVFLAYFLICFERFRNFIKL